MTQAQDCFLPGFVTQEASVESIWMRKTKGRMGNRKKVSMHLLLRREPHPQSLKTTLQRWKRTQWLFSTENQLLFMRAGQ